MIYNYAFNYVINHLQLSRADKSLKFEIICTHRTLNIILIFKKLGIIKNFFLIKKKFLIIRAYIHFYKLLSISKNFKLISTPSKFFFISFKALKLIHNRTKSSIFLLSTSRGMITHHEALKFKIGGKILLLITV